MTAAVRLLLWCVAGVVAVIVTFEGAIYGPWWVFALGLGLALVVQLVLISGVWIR